MAYAPISNLQGAGILGGVKRALSSVFDTLVMFAETGRHMDEVNKLNATSDEELAARGVTRADEVRRIFSNYI